MGFGGAFLRFGGVGLRALQFGCAAVALGIFSYFLSVLADRNLVIANKWRAVEGISGAAVLYTIAGVIFTLCLGGNVVFGYLAVVLDILFVGGFVAIAIMTRKGAGSCSGDVSTPIGDGPTNTDGGYGGFGFGNNQNSTYAVNLGLACRLNTAVFAVSIIAIFLFLVSAAWQIAMVKHHRKEKKYGPSPANNYTKGSGKAPFWKRNKKAHHRDVETAPVGTAVRPSGETGTTVGNNTYATTEPKFGEPGYGQTHYHNRTTGGTF